MLGPRYSITERGALDDLEGAILTGPGAGAEHTTLPHAAVEPAPVNDAGKVFGVTILPALAWRWRDAEQVAAEVAAAGAARSRSIDHVRSVLAGDSEDRPHGRES